MFLEISTSLTVLSFFLTFRPIHMLLYKLFEAFRMLTFCNPFRWVGSPFIAAVHFGQVNFKSLYAFEGQFFAIRSIFQQQVTKLPCSIKEFPAVDIVWVSATLRNEGMHGFLEFLLRPLHRSQKRGKKKNVLL